MRTPDRSMLVTSSVRGVVLLQPGIPGARPPAKYHVIHGNDEFQNTRAGRATDGLRPVLATMKPDYLILHGRGGSGPGHWQSWLAERLLTRRCNVRFPRFPTPDQPDLQAWLVVLKEELAAFGADSRLTVVCHSLAVLLWLHFVERQTAKLADRVILVAPPGPGPNVSKFPTFFPPPLNSAAIARTAGVTRLICSNADPYCAEPAARYYGKTLNLDVLLLPDEAAHINIDSGFGPWPLIETMCMDQSRSQPGRYLDERGSLQKVL